MSGKTTKRPHGRDPTVCSEMELAFVRAVLEGLNQTESARRAGYTGSDEVLATLGSRLRRRPKVATELLRQRAILESKSNMSREARLALAERFALDPNVRTRDRLKALELRARMAGDLLERRETTGAEGGPIKHEVTGKDGEALVPSFVPVTMAARRERALADLAAIDETERDLKELLASAAVDATKADDALADVDEGSETE